MEKIFKITEKKYGIMEKLFVLQKYGVFLALKNTKNGKIPFLRFYKSFMTLKYYENTAKISVIRKNNTRTDYKIDTRRQCYGALYFVISAFSSVFCNIKNGRIDIVQSNKKVIKKK